jgi:hypothetical protein
VKVQGLDGRVHPWKLAGRQRRHGGSSFHARARELLTRLYPNEPRLEEVLLPGTGKLRADFYLPARRTLVEVHGPQHYEFSLHLHKTRLGFLQSLARDRKKKEFCDLNRIRHVELPHHESDADWVRRLQGDGPGSAP